MPTHFHFLVVVNQRGCETITLKEKETHLQNFSKAIGKTLSSYTVAINKQEARTGNLFQKKTKAKLLDDSLLQGRYLQYCIHYIHNNPMEANMVSDSKDWEFSSLKDYAGFRNGTLCNQQLLFELSGMNREDFLNPIEADKLLFKELF